MALGNVKEDYKMSIKIIDCIKYINIWESKECIAVLKEICKN
jgi:hypothetical protein